MVKGGFIMAGYNQYIGMRYVPLIDGAWNSAKSYEPLVVVSYEGNSYISKTFVPAATLPTNETYWMLAANYNAQVEQYRQEVRQYQAAVDDVVEDVAAHDTAIDNLNGNVTALQVLEKVGFRYLAQAQGYALTDNEINANGGSATITNTIDLSTDAQIREFKRLNPNGAFTLVVLPAFINFGCTYNATATINESGSIAGGDFSLQISESYNVRNLISAPARLDVRTRMLVFGKVN
jgi:hypothetical protein